MAKFQKGQSGNPAGKPKGTKSYVTHIRHQLKEAIPELLEKTKEQALAGDMTAMKLLLERCLPAQKPQYPRFELPALIQAETATDKDHAIYQAVAAGELSADMGAHLIQSLRHFLKVKEMEEITVRVAQIEEKLKTLDG